MDKITNAKKIMERGTFSILQKANSAEFLLIELDLEEYYLGDRNSTALPDRAFYEAIEVRFHKSF